jgi:hypothetical protein
VRDGRGDADDRRQAGGDQVVAGQRQALRDQPGLGVGAGVEALGDARLAGGEQALRGEDLVELVRMRQAVEMDAVEGAGGQEQDAGHEPDPGAARHGGAGRGGDQVHRWSGVTQAGNF